MVTNLVEVCSHWHYLALSLLGYVLEESDPEKGFPFFSLGIV